MMMYRVFICLIMLINFIATPAMAAIDIDISEPKLEITTGFSGDTLTVFGTAEPEGDIVILIRGPQKDTIIRRKIDVMGLWVQAESVTFMDVFGYYNIASSIPVNQITDPLTLSELRLGLDSLTFQTKTKTNSDKYSRFQESLIQNMQLRGLYSLTPNAVVFLNDSLFKTRLAMPAHVPLGNYTIEAFLFKDGILIDKDIKPFTVTQIGLTGEVHKFAFTEPFLYGVTVIFIALLAGLMANLLLRRD